MTFDEWKPPKSLWEDQEVHHWMALTIDNWTKETEVILDIDDKIETKVILSNSA